MTTLPEHAIRAEKIQRRYKSKEKELIALSDVDLTVPPGELFGLLGPNGAGKTTLIKILTTLLLPSGGKASVWGYDVAKESVKVRRRISMVSGGESSGYGLLTVRENLWMFGQFYGLDSRTSRARIDELLEVVGLADRAGTKVSHLSTGLRQKMNFCRGFLSDPSVLFLDEPTLGLDVEAARILRAYTRQWVDRGEGKTILLTTHYMQEADELCDRVAIISRGKIIACDTPAALKRGLQSEAIYRLHTTPVDGVVSGALESLAGVQRLSIEQQDGRSELMLILADDSVLGSVLGCIDANDASLIALEKREPTLEDVFVARAGQTLAEAQVGT